MEGRGKSPESPSGREKVASALQCDPPGLTEGACRRRRRKLAGALALVTALALGASSITSWTAWAEDFATVTVTALLPTKNNCKFRSAPLPLDFGILSPGGPDVSASTSIQFRCQGANLIAWYAVTADLGLNSSGPGVRQMQHTTLPAYSIPYEITLTGPPPPLTKMIEYTIDIDGVVRGPSYIGRAAGVYQDVITLTIEP